MRLWYLRRAVPWTVVLGCSALAVLAAASLRAWPDTAWGVLPLVLAACAAASGFVYDELATAVTAVTPRGGTWGLSARLLAGLVPLGVLALLLATAPAALALDRVAWLLAGLATVAVATGTAAWCARGQLPRPGPAVAGAVALLVLAPMVAGPFLGWESVFPWGARRGWMTGLWGALAVVGTALAASACAPVRTVRSGGR